MNRLHHEACGQDQDGGGRRPAANDSRDRLKRQQGSDQEQIEERKKELLAAERSEVAGREIGIAMTDRQRKNA
jgi:hypothetical protein